MQEYVIAMKSGNAFRVTIKDFAEFVSDVERAVRPNTLNNFCAQGGVMFNIGDVSAIYPLAAQQSVQADVCQSSPLGTHRFINDDAGEICIMCGTRR